MVCTAGITNNGKWIRIYPIPFRKLNVTNRYVKYQWVELELKKNLSDPRPESYKPISYENIILGETIDTDNGKWTRRKDLILKNVYTDMNQLINEAQDESICTSLAVFKPKEIINFKTETINIEDNIKKIAALKEKAKQLSLFETSENPFDMVKKVPFKFSYEFIDEKDKKMNLMIEDWEIFQLYWNCLKRHNDNMEQALNDVKKMYDDNFLNNKDIYLFLGTTRVFHFFSKNPFIIIGVFYPPLELQASLF